MCFDPFAIELQHGICSQQREQCAARSIATQCVGLGQCAKQVIDIAGSRRQRIAEERLRVGVGPCVCAADFRGGCWGERMVGRGQQALFDDVQFLRAKRLVGAADPAAIR